ncbi:glycosyltransferase [bacterium]|nr:glycosyltransferase [bacterium]
MEYNIIDIFLSCMATVYGLFVLILTGALLIYRSPRSQKDFFVSVLIPARNEERHIGECLEALALQDYNQDKFEIIVINDRSTDRTSAIAREFENKFKHFTIVDIKEMHATMAPKKNALNEGIKIAKGEIIVCSDADCYAEVSWIRSMTECFTSEVGMVIGYSPIKPLNRWSVFHHFVALDSLALASAAAASCLWNKPVTATGRSLAYRKEVFNEVGGFSKIAHFVSGDDDLLLGLVKKTKWKMAYTIRRNSLVETHPPLTFRQFVNQKIRQASKGRHYSVNMVITLVLYYIFNLMLMAYAPLYWLDGHKDFWKWYPWIMKFSSDFVLLFVGAVRFKKLFYLSMYPILVFLHPLYIAVFGAWGQFGKFDWKDTTHDKHLKV